MAINIDNTYRINRSLEQDEQMRYLRDLKIFDGYVGTADIFVIVFETV